MKKLLILLVCLNACGISNNSDGAKRVTDVSAARFCDFVDMLQQAVNREDASSFKALIEFPVEIKGSTDYDVSSMDEREFEMFFPNFLDEWAGTETVDTYLDKGTGMTKTLSSDTVRNQIISGTEKCKSKCEDMILNQYRIGPLNAERRHEGWRIVTIYSDWSKVKANNSREVKQAHQDQ
ncbi:MAG: hypothetical protein ABI162_12350 [Luteolibacter sp.]